MHAKTCGTNIMKLGCITYWNDGNPRSINYAGLLSSVHNGNGCISCNAVRVGHVWCQAGVRVWNGELLAVVILCANI